MPAQKRCKKALVLICTDLEVLHKQKVKAKAELPTAQLSVEGVPQDSHRVTQQKLGDIVISDI